MINTIEKKRGSLPFRILSLIIVFSFIFSIAVPNPAAYAQSLLLPTPGTRISLTPHFNPAIIQGITVHPENPLEFDFIINTGDAKLEGQVLREEFHKLVNYFLAALTVPEQEVWVNLSPYEKDQMISRNFGDTEMGRDLLAQDYMLKQLTASLMYPEEELGGKFWRQVYRKAQDKYGTTNVPITTFAKVWIVPDQAVVYEQGANAVVLKSHLKVMLEEDYLALQKNIGLAKHGLDRISQAEAKEASAISSEVVKEFLISEIEKEVNSGKTFAKLRQIYNSLILATWFKSNLKQSLLGQVYVDQDKTKGVDVKDKQVNQKIYSQYLEAFKKGVFNYIRSDYDLASRKNIRRRYFSGGTDFAGLNGILQTVENIPPELQLLLANGDHRAVKINLAEIPQGAEVSDVEKAVQMPTLELAQEAGPPVTSIIDIETQYRKPIVGGNLKREFKKGDVERLLGEIVGELKSNNIDSRKVDVFLAPAELDVGRFARALKEKEAKGEIPPGLIKLGAQNVSHRDELGAFTGQLATAQQLKEYGVQYVIVGHSEARRGSEKDTYEVRYRETNPVINTKIHTLINAGLTPVLAFGETNDERSKGKKFDVVREQVLGSLEGVTAEQILSSGLVLAYEPVWAIGSGQAAEKEKVNTMHRFVRNGLIREKYGPEVAAKIRIQYGGSVKPSNVAEFVNEPNVDGGLIGGAAKKGENFVPIMKGFSKVQAAKAVLTGPSLFAAVEAEEAQTNKEAVVMAANIRTPLSLEGIMQAAKETGSVVVFQQALSEFGYTWPVGFSPENAYRFAEEIRRTGRRVGFSNYVLKADHVTVKVDKDFLKDTSAQKEIENLLETMLAKKTNAEREAVFNAAFNNRAFMSDKNVAKAMESINKALSLLKAEVNAGMTIYALDASFMPTRLNVLATAFLAGFLPEDSSIEAEVGEIGGQDNSTVADALEFITGVRYKEKVERDPETNAIVYSELVRVNKGNPVVESEGEGLLHYGVNIDRLAINNGTAHGNNYDKDGNIIKTQMNLKMTTAIAEAIAPYGIKIVQHGVTGTPLESLPALRTAGITEAHVGTNWQNVVWQSLNEIAKEDKAMRDLRDRMLDSLIDKYGEKYNISARRFPPALRRVLRVGEAPDKDLDKMIGKELKNILGFYQEEFDVLPQGVKDQITVATKKSALDHFKAFGATGMDDAIAKQVLRVKRDNYPLLVTSQTAAELTALGLRGAYQKALDIVKGPITAGKDVSQQIRMNDLKELFEPFEALAKDAKVKKKISDIINRVSNPREADVAISDKELKQMKAAIKDVADGVAKRIFERTAKEQNIILMVRVSEGFGRDEVAESLKANEVIMPGEINNEGRQIQAAINSGEEFYQSKVSGKLYPIADVIVDVVEGTNQFVTNSGNKSLDQVPDHEAGGTSMIIQSYGKEGVVRALGNAPDGYVGQFITNLGEYADEFNQKKVLVAGEGKPTFYSLKDPELYARHPGMIVEYLQFLAQTRGQKLEELEEEIVIMDRDRETAFLNELRKLQARIPGLKVVGEDQKGIPDGTVAHGLKASMSKDMYEQLTGRFYGPHKTVVTIGGSAEGFYNLGIASQLQDSGTVAGLRVYSMKMNKNSQGQVMKDQSQRYAFTAEEQKDIRQLRAQYGDAQDILSGKKLFTERDFKGEAVGLFTFISNNGVFHQPGTEQKSENDITSRALEIGKIKGRIKAGIITDTRSLIQPAVEQTVVASLSGDQIGKVAAETAKVEQVLTPALAGRGLYDALKADSAGQKAVTMCTNIRTPLSLDGIMQAAKETNSVVILQQAISEFDYTWPGGYKPENTYQLAEEARAAGTRNNFSDYVLKADHVTVKVDKEFLKDSNAQAELGKLLEAVLKAKTNAEREEIFNKAFTDSTFMSNPSIAKAMKSIKKAVEHVKAAVGAGYTVYALDASFMPMKLNILATSLLAGFIPDNASVEGEVGEIGGSENSTVEEALEFVNGIRSYGVNIDRLAINNGTAHGNNYDKDGNLIKTAMNLKLTAEISEALVPYGIKIVQHGVTGTPLENLPALHAAGITSAHVGTNWQNIVWETLNQIAKKDKKVQGLTNRIVDNLIELAGEKYGVKQRQASLAGRIFGDASNQKNLQKLIGKELKNLLGKYKAELDSLPQAVKDQINAATKKSAVGHFKAFKSDGTAEIAKKHAQEKVAVVRSGQTQMAIGTSRDAVLNTPLGQASSSTMMAQERFVLARSIAEQLEANGIGRARFYWYLPDGRETRTPTKDSIAVIIHGLSGDKSEVQVRGIVNEGLQSKRVYGDLKVSSARQHGDLSSIVRDQAQQDPNLLVLIGLARNSVYTKVSATASSTVTLLKTKQQDKLAMGFRKVFGQVKRDKGPAGIDAVWLLRPKQLAVTTFAGRLEMAFPGTQAVHKEGGQIVVTLNGKPFLTFEREAPEDDEGILAAVYHNDQTYNVSAGEAFKVSATASSATPNEVVTDIVKKLAKRVRFSSRVPAVTTDNIEQARRQKPEGLVIFEDDQRNKVKITEVQASKDGSWALSVSVSAEGSRHTDAAVEFDSKGEPTVYEYSVNLLAAINKRTASSVVSAPERTGGINLDPRLINLQIKRDPNGVPLPVFQQPLQNIKIRGFLPVIIKISPVDFREFIGFDSVFEGNSRSKKVWN